MYTLRIIDQMKVGGEESRNIYLGNKYDVLMKVEVTHSIKEHTNMFTRAVSEFLGFDFKEVNNTDPIPVDSTITGLVYFDNTTIPIRNFEVAYIVNNEGKTFERLYGQYKKY